MKTMALIQARLSSTRLPNKVLADICGKPMLIRVAERVARVRELTDYAVLLSGDPADQPIVTVCQQWHVPVLVCPHVAQADVLGRYAVGAVYAKADRIVRVTADCPLLDPALCGQVIRALASSDAGYAANIQPYTEWADGLDCEAFEVDVLMEADRAASRPYDREHVTPWMRACTVCTYVPSPEDMRALKYSVDLPEDLARVRRIYHNLHSERADGWLETLQADRPRHQEAP